MTSDWQALATPIDGEVMLSHVSDPLCTTAIASCGPGRPGRFRAWRLLHRAQPPGRSVSGGSPRASREGHLREEPGSSAGSEASPRAQRAPQPGSHRKGPHPVTGARYAGSWSSASLTDATGSLFDAVLQTPTAEDNMAFAQDQHLAWLARSFGRPDYLPLTEEDARALIKVAEPVSRYTGSHLFKEGEPAEAAFLIESGQVDLYRMHSGSRRVVARVGPGSVLGDIAMFGEGTYISSARAVTGVKAFRFRREALIPELAQHPALCLRWLVAGLRQLQQTQRRIVHLMHKTVLAQVADLLIEESTHNSGSIELSQAAIGILLGASRQTVNEALGTLRELGAIETGYRRITVVDADTLTRVAAGETV